AGDLGAVRIEHHRRVEQLLRPLLYDRAAVHVGFGDARGLAQELVGGAAGLVGALRRQRFGVGVAHRAVAAEAVPHLRQADDVGAVGFYRLADQAARLGNVVRLVGAGVHLDDGDTHRQAPA